jgi:hypothetical protein
MIDVCLIDAPPCSAASSEVPDKDKLLQFEMCEYNTGVDGTLTWRDYPYKSQCPTLNPKP